MATKVTFTRKEVLPPEVVDGNICFQTKDGGGVNLYLGVDDQYEYVGAPLEKGFANGAVQQRDAIYGEANVAGTTASGFQAVAFGGMRPDKLNDTTRSATSAEGIQSFAAGGCAHAYGDFSVALGKDTKAYMRGSIALGGGGAEAGMTVAEFNDKFATADQKALSGYDRTKINGGLDIHIVDSSKEHYEYPNSYSFALAHGQDSVSKGRVSVAMGNNVKAYGDYSFAVNSLNEVGSKDTAAFGYANYVSANTDGTFISGYHNLANAGIYNHISGGTNTVYDGSYSTVEGSDNVLNGGNQSHLGGKFNTNYSMRTVVYGYNNFVGNSDGSVDYTNGPTSPNVRTFRDVDNNPRNTSSGIAAYSDVRGLGNEVYSKASVVAGIQNYTDADNSYIFGYRNLVRAASLSQSQTDLFYATVFGGTNYVHGNARFSFTAGSDNEVSGNQAAAIGKGHQVPYQRSVALNSFNITGRDSQTVVGTYNYPDHNALFVVGYGTGESDRRNAFTVNSKGTATIANEPINKFDVVNKGYVDNLISQITERLNAIENQLTYLVEGT